MIKKLLPPSLNQKPFKEIAEALDIQLQKVWEELVNVLIYPRIDEIENEELLDLLGWQFHIEGWELAKTVEEKRRLVKSAIELHRYKGTPYAVKKALEFFGVKASLLEWFKSEGSLPPYTFALITPNIVNTKKVVQLIEDFKNERSKLVLITDNSCRKRANLDRSSILSRSVLSALDGVEEEEGVKVCFTRKNSNSSLWNCDGDLGGKRIRQLYATTYKGLDTFKIPFSYRAIGEKIANNLRSQPFSLNTSLWEKRYAYTNCSLVLSAGRLDQKGFESSYIQGREVLSSTKLSSKSYRKVPVICRFKHRNFIGSYSFESQFFATRIASHTIKAAWGSPYLDGYRWGSTLTREHISKFTGRRAWVGTWKGFWTDSYTVGGQLWHS